VDVHYLREKKNLDLEGFEDHQQCQRGRVRRISSSTPNKNKNKLKMK
jgi:hypothetical protein